MLAVGVRKHVCKHVGGYVRRPLKIHTGSIPGALLEHLKFRRKLPLVLVSLFLHQKVGQALATSEGAMQGLFAATSASHIETKHLVDAIRLLSGRDDFLTEARLWTSLAETRAALANLRTLKKVADVAKKYAGKKATHFKPREAAEVQEAKDALRKAGFICFGV